MRYFTSLEEAGEEIKRDVYKGTPVTSSRVQQFEGIDLNGHERVAYEYGILKDFPIGETDLVALGQKLGLPLYLEHPLDMETWLREERWNRLWRKEWWYFPPPEKQHPALRNTLEGEYPAYTYGERLEGALEALVATLARNPDSRRAYWPVFRPEDAIRAMRPTRIPCTLGYQVMIRVVGDKMKLLMIYYQRSSDFDTFWLSDIWLARQFQEAICDRLNRIAPLEELTCGMLMHFIASFHSFNNREEIY